MRRPQNTCEDWDFVSPKRPPLRQQIRILQAVAQTVYKGRQQRGCIMRKLLWLTTAVLALATMPALAENWIQVVQQDGMTVSVDRDSIARNGDIADFQSQIVWDAVQYNSLMSGGKYKWERNSEEIDCVKQTYENKSARFFDDTGAVVFSENSEGVQPIRPNSVAALKQQTVCG